MTTGCLKRALSITSIAKSFCYLQALQLYSKHSRDCWWSILLRISDHTLLCTISACQKPTHPICVVADGELPSVNIKIIIWNISEFEVKVYNGYLLGEKSKLLDVVRRSRSTSVYVAVDYHDKYSPTLPWHQRNMAALFFAFDGQNYSRFV